MFCGVRSGRWHVSTERMPLEWPGMTRSLSSWQACFHSAPVSMQEWLVSENHSVGLPIPLWKKGMPGFLTRSLRTTWLDFVESASGVELASDVASYVGVHVGLTIFSSINYYIPYQNRVA